MIELNNKKYGFTLIETIVYIALLSIVMYGALITSYELIDSAGALQSRATVQEEGNFVLRKVNWALTGLDSSNPPTISGSGCSQAITLNKTNFARNPIVLYLKSIYGINYVQIKEGSSDLSLTTENASTTCLKFSLIAGSPLGVRATTTINNIDFAITKYLRK